MPNGDGECKYCGGPGTPYGIKHEEDCSFVQGQRRIDILTGKRITPEDDDHIDYTKAWNKIDQIAREQEMTDESKNAWFEAAALDNKFTYHPPKGDQPERYEYLRKQALNLATDIVRNCPDSRERSLALTKLEEAIFWANASIARNE